MCSVPPARITSGIPLLPSLLPPPLPWVTPVKELLPITLLLLPIMLLLLPLLLPITLLLLPLLTISLSRYHR